VDEVLAVGDAEFQRKCLGKIKDVSGKEGRTVLFVSHSMTSVQTLCNKGIYLDKGRTIGIESVNSCIEKYLYGNGQQVHLGEYNGESATYHTDMRNQVKVLRVQLLNEKGESGNRFKTTEPVTIRIDWNNIAGIACSPNLMIKTAMGVNVLIASDSPVDWDGTKKKEKGIYQSDFTIPPHLLNANDYYLSVALDSHSPKVCYESHVDVLRIVLWDPMDETSIARGMFVTVREDVVLWPALQCSFKQIKTNANTYI
jgi:lipopolysaccharide transport system ATP-binding protein